jgi:glutathione S-transferase
MASRIACGSENIVGPLSVANPGGLMKLYTKPGACSTADHIALQWTGAPFEVEVLDAAALKSPAYLAINPAGAVPALVDQDAEGGRFVLTQNAAILGYIADRHPQAGLAGDGSARQRAEATRWLAFANSDVHPAFKPLFGPAGFHPDPAQHEALKDAARARLRRLFEAADRQLDGRDWLAGFRSYADPYLYVVLRWAKAAGVDLSGLDRLQAFVERMQADAGVQAALRAEGLRPI